MLTCLPPIHLCSLVNREREQSTFSTQLLEKQKSLWEKNVFKRFMHVVPYALVNLYKTLDNDTETLDFY